MALDKNNKPLAAGDAISIDGKSAVVVSADQSQFGHNVLAQFPTEAVDDLPRYVAINGSECQKEND